MIIVTKAVQIIPYLSAPAHDNILLMRTMWKGWGRTRMWNASLPQCFTRYLLQQIRPASSASEDSCSYSSETKWTLKENSSTPALLRPRSNILIFESENIKYTTIFLCMHVIQTILQLDNHNYHIDECPYYWEKELRWNPLSQPVNFSFRVDLTPAKQGGCHLNWEQRYNQLCHKEADVLILMNLSWLLVSNAKLTSILTSRYW